MSNQPVIEVAQLECKFGSHVVLSSVNLCVHAQDRIAVVGPSGSGKTVLLKLISGLVVGTSGQVKLWGQQLDPDDTERTRLVTQRVGMLFQQNALFDSLSVLDNVVFPLLEVKKFSLDEAQAKAHEVLKDVGLDHVVSNAVSEISGGMQKRLGIARAVALEPELLLYDDPTAGLDPITSRKIADLILSLQSRLKSTFVVVTNDMARAAQLGSRVFFCKNQQLIEVGPPATAFGQKTDSFDGKSWSTDWTSFLGRGPENEASL
jgi:phospholipid/cholesterol/gamma-HCH transport system ATP-binding protein